ncbi:MAG TPA: endolytic transglycosylase MltG, partial [Clostridiales bacterium]|nr:endolytic transglycosylase MltG [Clostridiales bacterium]
YFDVQSRPVNANDSEKITVEIPTGSSSAKIADILKENKLIKSKIVFQFLSKKTGADGRMKAGNYSLSPAMSTQDIIHILVKGDIANDSVKITIPEGFELNQIIARLEKHGLIDKEKFIQIANYQDFNYPFLKDVPKGENRLEGYLFPDTYLIPKHAKEEDIIMKMLDRFQEVFKEEYYERAKELNMSIHEVVTLASIIEREAKLDEERPIISSVFHNRLQKGMPLQSCATVQYILGERKAVLSTKDLQIDSPYNTYKYLGLPPNPIASPGESSIRAALYPEKTDYLYFVASKEGNGHIFSRTFQEHVQAKNANRL